MTIRLACVYFPNEKKNYVVPVKDIINLERPKSVNDFNPKKSYDVKWPILQRQDSDTTDDTFKGKIQLLAASPASMISQASKAKPVIRLPQAFLSANKQNTQNEGKLAKGSAIAVSKRVSKQARKQVNAAMKESVQARMKELLAVHRQDYSSSIEALSAVDNADNLRDSQDNNGPKKTDAEKEVNLFVTQEPSNGTSKSGVALTTEKTSKRKHKSSSSSDESFESSSAQKVLVLEKRITQLQQELAFERKKCRVAQTDVTSLRLTIEHWEKAFTTFSASVSAQECASPGVFKVTVSNKAFNESPYKRPNLQRSYEVTVSPRIDKWVESTMKYSGEKRVAQRVVQAADGAGKVSLCRTLFPSSPVKMKEVFQGSKSQSIRSSDNAKLKVSSLVPGGKKSLEEDKDSSSTHSIKSSKQGSANESKPLSISSRKSQSRRPFSVLNDNIAHTNESEHISNQLSPTHKSVNKQGTPVREKADSSHQRTPATASSKKGSSLKASNEDKDSHETTKAAASVASSPEVVKKKVKKSPKKAKSSANELGPNEKSNVELAKMILRALKGEEDLQEDKKGKVLIGNDIYIKRSVWDKIKKEDIKLSIAVKDLAEEIWGFKNCAKYSVTGGISPKNSKGEKKEVAPAGGIEAIYGFFRAKKMYEGLTTDIHLKDALKMATHYLREKFNDSSKKMMRLMKEAKSEGQKKEEDKEED